MPGPRVGGGGVNLYVHTHTHTDTHCIGHISLARFCKLLQPPSFLGLTFISHVKSMIFVQVLSQRDQ